MNVLIVNPPVYTFYGFHNTHQYVSYLYSIASKLKASGDNVTIVDLHPEMAFNATSKGGSLSVNGGSILSDTGIVVECGNFDVERLAKPVLRSGLDISSLDGAVAGKSIDRVIIGDMGSKSDVSSSSFYYSNLGISEVIDRLRTLGYAGTIETSGKYTKIFKKSLDVSSFYDNDCESFDVDFSLLTNKPRRINVLTKLGCHNACSFCFVGPLEGEKTRVRTPQSTLKYIGKILDNGYNKIRLMDSDVLSDWDSNLKIVFDGIVNNGYKVSISSYGGYEPSMVTEEIIENSLLAGMNEIILPLDNSDCSVLTSWGGAKTVEAWKNAVKITKKFTNNIVSYIMIGYPGQKLSNVADSIAMCMSEGVNPGLLPFTPMGGTSYEECSISPKKIHPLLFPYASDQLTVFQIESLLEQYSKWYKKNTVLIDNPENTYITTGKPILTNSWSKNG